MPSNWDLLFRVPQDDITGFEATIFKNVFANEIVISFAGTDSPGDLSADLALAAGNRYHVEQFKPRGCGELAIAKGL
jgi:hypothetical protein